MPRWKVFGLNTQILFSISLETGLDNDTSVNEMTFFHKRGVPPIHTDLCHFMKQQQWNGDGGYAVSDSCMQCIPQAHYHWIPRADWWRFYAIIHNQMEYNVDLGEVRVPCDVNISYIKQQRGQNYNVWITSMSPSWTLLGYFSSVVWFDSIRHGLRINFFQVVVFNPCQSSPFFTILVPLWFIIISLVFICLSKLLFSGFIQFQGNFVRGQNISKYREWTALIKVQLIHSIWNPQRKR